MKLEKILFLCPKINLDRPSGGTMHYLDLTACMARKYPKLKVTLAASGKGWKRRKKNLEIIAAPDIGTTILKPDEEKTERINGIIRETNPDYIYYRTEPFEDFPLHIESDKPKVIEIGYNLFAKPYDIPAHISVLWFARNALLSRWLKDAVRPFDCVLVQSRSSGRSLERRIKDKPIRVVMDAAHTGKFSPSSKARGKVRIVFVGNHLKYQGAHLLVEAARYMESEDYEITIIGDYSKTNFPEAGKISFAGFLPNEKVVKLLERSDIGVAPYLEAKNEPYGFSPIKIFEYMSAGLAVVAADTEWNREIIKDGTNGILFRENDPKNLAKKLDRLAMNRRLLGKIKKQSRKDARKHDWAIRSGDILKIFRSISYQKDNPRRNARTGRRLARKSGKGFRAGLLTLSRGKVLNQKK